MSAEPRENAGEPQDVVGKLRKALAWALPLARIAQEAHRAERVQHGHSDIQGTRRNGEVWAGLWQSEIDDCEFAEDALAASHAGQDAQRERIRAEGTWQNATNFCRDFALHFGDHPNAASMSDDQLQAVSTALMFLSNYMNAMDKGMRPEPNILPEWFAQTGERQ